MTRPKIRNEKAKYQTRSVLGGANVTAPISKEGVLRPRDNFKVDAAGYFVWPRGPLRK